MRSIGKPMVASVLFLALTACEGQFVVEDNPDGSGTDDPGLDDTATDDTGDTGDTAEVDTAQYEGASLFITAPASGAFLPYGEEASFEAEVRDAAGNVLPFDDIAWSSDIDGAWRLAGASVEDDGLEVGTHALTAMAELPNGDRLAYTIGGVLVQSAYTGIYTGTLVVNATAEYDGTAYSAGCSGAITLVVDARGETAEGDAGCLLSLLTYELDTTYVFDLENDDGDLEGTAALDLSFYQLDIDATGEISDEGEATLAFEQDVAGLLYLDGSVEVTRVSRNISDYDPG